MKMISKVCVACFFLCCVLSWESSYVLGLSKQEREQEILSKLLDKSRYNKRARPSGKDDKGPTNVTVNLYVRSIDNVDDDKMEYGVQLTLRQQWNDKRLQYDQFGCHKCKTCRIFETPEFKYLTLADISQVWIPDLFFSNEKTAHEHKLMKPNHYLRIFPDGEVQYSTRITLTLSCPMILKRIPVDSQTCSIRIASYGFTTEDIIFKWKAYDPVQVTSDLHIRKFALEEFTTDYCDSQTNTGIYSCLRVDFLLRRDFNPSLFYIPTTMMVIVAWLGSWLDRKAVTARILVCLSTLFVLALETSRFISSFPTVHYAKSIDNWIGWTHIFVFACFVEFIVVNYLSGREDEEKADNSIITAKELPNNETASLNDEHLNYEIQQANKNIRQTAENVSKMPRCRCKSQIVDTIFRIGFPILYVIFLIIYAYC